MNPSGSGNNTRNVNGNAADPNQEDFYVTSGLRDLSQHSIFHLDLMATCNNVNKELQGLFMAALKYYSRRKQIDIEERLIQKEDDHYKNLGYKCENFSPDSRSPSPSRSPGPSSSSRAARAHSEESVRSDPSMKADAADDNNSIVSPTYDAAQDELNENEHPIGGGSTATPYVNFDESPESPPLAQDTFQGEHLASQVATHTHGHSNDYDAYDSPTYRGEEDESDSTWGESRPSSRVEGEADGHSSQSPVRPQTGVGSVDVSRTASPACGMWIVDEEERSPSPAQGPSPIKKARTATIDDAANPSSPAVEQSSPQYAPDASSSPPSPAVHNYDFDFQPSTPAEAESLSAIAQQAADYAKSNSYNGNGGNPSSPGYNPWSPGPGYGPSSPGDCYGPSSPGVGYGPSSPVPGPYSSYPSSPSFGYGPSSPGFGCGPSSPGGYLGMPMQGTWNGFAPALRCAFCSSDSHPPERCTVHITHEARSRMKNRLNLCAYCLGKHYFRDCPLPPQMRLCGHCGRHRSHKALCTVLCP